MPAPLPLDLREHIVKAYFAGEGTIPMIAGRFDVGTATIERCLALYRSTGVVQPRPHAGGPAACIPDEKAHLLIHWLQENSSLTQQELAEMTVRGPSV